MVYMEMYHVDEDEDRKAKRTTPRILCDELPNCPECENSPMVDPDTDCRLKQQGNVRRHFKKDGGEVKWYEIPRGACPNCKSVMRILPDFMAPFKHYATDVMSGYLSGRTDNIDVTNPSDWTLENWDKWLSDDRNMLSQFGIEEMKKDGISENWIGVVLVRARSKGVKLVTGRKKNRRDND